MPSMSTMPPMRPSSWPAAWWRRSTAPGARASGATTWSTFQVDGTQGSAVAGLQKCWTQSRVNTPKPVWNPDIAQPIDFFAGWQEVPDTIDYPNGFRAQWELFLRHLIGEDADFRWNLEAGARGVQLAEAGLQSWHERRWIDLPALELA